MRVSTGDPGAQYQYHGAGILEKIVKTIGQIHLDSETLVLTAHEMSPIGQFKIVKLKVYSSQFVKYGFD